jgi:hypothetical protein
LLVIYTPSYVYSARNLGLACRLAKGSAPKREIRITSKKPTIEQGCYFLVIVITITREKNLFSNYYSNNVPYRQVASTGE